jgi:Family of unknown function (DUF5990)
VLIRIVGHDLPGSSCGPGPDYPDGHLGIHVAVQRRDKPAELTGLTPGDAARAEWELDCTATTGPDALTPDLKGPFLQGGPGQRFIYLSWGVVERPGEFVMFRRAKLMLDGVPSDALRQAVAAGVLVGRVGLTDEKGNPRCAAVRPPLIEWTSG